MPAGAVKKSPVIMVKKKRQITPVTENVPATPDREKSPSAASESPVVSPQPQTPPSGLTKKQRKLLRHKERQRQIRRDNLRNGRLKLPLFRQVFPERMDSCTSCSVFTPSDLNSSTRFCSIFCETTG